MKASLNSYATPPTLEPGGVIRFRTTEQLASTFFRELSAGRLSAVDLVEAKLFEQDTFMIVVAADMPRIEAVGMCVHRQGDVVGLQISISDPELRRLKAMIEHVTGDVDAHVESDEPVAAPTEAAPVRDGDIRQPDEETGGLLVQPPVETRPPAELKTVQIQRPAKQPAASPESAPVGGQQASVSQGQITPMRGARSFVVGSRGTLFGILLDLQRRCQSGQLTIVHGGGHWSMFLDAHGCVADFDLDLVESLIEIGLLEESAAKASRGMERLSAACARLSGPGSSVSLPPIPSLRTAAAKSLIARLTRLAEQPGATYYFDQGVRVYDTGIPIPFVVYGMDWVTEVAEALRLAEIDGLFQGKLEQYPVALDDPTWTAELFDFSGAERRFVETTLSRGEPLRQILTLSPMSRSHTLRCLFRLQAMRLLTFRSSPDSVEESTEPLVVLRSKLARARTGYFGALGLHVTAHHTEFPEVVNTAREQYGVGTDMSTSGGESASMCAELLTLMDEAHRFLADADRRIDYRRAQHTDTELAGFAQLLVDKMRLALLRGEQLKAIHLKQVAVELCPRVVRDALKED